MNNDGEIISVYTQNQAVEDGFLVDVTDLAQEAGFQIPVHITCGVQSLCEVPERLDGLPGLHKTPLGHPGDPWNEVQ